MKEDHTRQQIVSGQLFRQLLVALLVRAIGWLIVGILHHDLF